MDGNNDEHIGNSTLSEWMWQLSIELWKDSLNVMISTAYALCTIPLSDCTLIVSSRMSTILADYPFTLPSIIRALQDNGLSISLENFMNLNRFSAEEQDVSEWIVDEHGMIEVSEI